jgi:hypothetical protein
MTALFAFISRAAILQYDSHTLTVFQGQITPLKDSSVSPVIPDRMGTFSFGGFEKWLRHSNSEMRSPAFLNLLLMIYRMRFITLMASA